MTKPELIKNVRTMINRHQWHFESGNHILYPGSQHEIALGEIAYFRENDPKTGQLNTNGFIVAPAGSGKTMSLGDFIIGINTMPNGRYVLGNPTLGKRVLIGVHSNEMARQWGDRLLGKFDEAEGKREPSAFGDRFTEETVGIYHPDLSDAEKEIVFSKPVIIMVHDSIQLSCARTNPRTGQPFMRAEDFDAVIIDEVDEKVRGDVTREFYKETFFPHCLIIGATATQFLRDGRSIGYYLFGDKKPICEIVHEQGVMRREIAPHINIIVQTQINPASIIKPPRTVRWEEYSEAQQMRFVEQTGIDNALFQAIKVGHHPKTGQPLREIMQIHKAVNIDHGRKLAKQYNNEFGHKFAQAVWGRDDEEMDDEMRRITKWMLETGELTAVIQCKLYSRGTDIPPLGLTVQHVPMLSPNGVVQFHTRGSRKDDGYKIALYMSPDIPGIEGLIVGELLGGLVMIPDGFEYRPTAGKINKPSIPDPWPEIEGVKFYYTEKHLEMFAKERQRQRYVNGLPKKTRQMWAVDEMARALGIHRDLLSDRVFTPLQEAYEKKQAREQFVDIESRHSGEFVHLRGRMYPAWRVGFYQHNAQEVFCVDQALKRLCEYTLYGRLDPARPELLSRDVTRRLLGCTDAQVGELWNKLQNAFFYHEPYEQSVDIDNITFSYDSFGFYRNRNGDSEFYISPDALTPAYRHFKGVDEGATKAWAEESKVQQCKTSEWYSQADVMEALGINPVLGNDDSKFIRAIFDVVGQPLKNLVPGRVVSVDVGIPGNKRTLKCSNRWLPLADSKDEIATCIHESSLEWIKREVGIESAYDGTTRTRWEQSRYGERPEANP